MAVKQVRVSDLSGRQAAEDEFAKLIVHEHPQYQGPITLDVLPEEIRELPETTSMSIEIIQPGERHGQRALLSVDRFNQLAASGDMHTVLMNAVADQQPQRPAQPRRRGRGTRNGRARSRRQVEWGLPHRGRISPEEAAYVREHLDEVQKLRSERGVPLLDPTDPRTRSATAYRAWRLQQGPGARSLSVVQLAKPIAGRLRTPMASASHRGSEADLEAGK